MPTFINGYLAGRKRNYFLIECHEGRNGSVDIYMVTDGYGNHRLEIRRFGEGRTNEKKIVPTNKIIATCMKHIEEVKEGK